MQNTREARLLTALYGVHEEWLQGLNLACGPGCASCCTRSVNITGLEGREVLCWLRENGRSLPRDFNNRAAASNSGHTPLTTNRFARLCLSGTEPPEQPENPWDLSPCPFLENNLCSIYPVRPMMCRAFASQRNCAEGGVAEVAPPIITANTVFLQLIEHIAAGEIWGNMLEVLHTLDSAPENPAGVAQAEPIPGYLIPPEEEAYVSALFDRLGAVNLEGKSLLHWLQQGRSGS